MQKKNILILILKIIVILIACFMLIFNHILQEKARFFAFKTQEVEIPKNYTALQAIDLLKKEKLIKSKLKFRLSLLILKKEKDIKAGKYKLKANMPNRQIIKILTSHTNNPNMLQASKRITIPEGLTILEVADIFAKEELTKKDDFLRFVNNLKNNKKMLALYPFLKEVPIDSIEGYLFPDTYIFANTASPELILDLMFKRFQEKVLPLYANRPAEHRYSLHDTLSIASIVEKESLLKEERPIVASVFYNRLNYNMHLASCPTVKYALGDPQKPMLYYKDLEVQSPYNTYRVVGLPPGPICSPGYKSIEATLYPANTDYLYFSARGDGSNQFSRTFREHNFILGRDSE